MRRLTGTEQKVLHGLGSAKETEMIEAFKLGEVGVSQLRADDLVRSNDQFTFIS